MSTDLDAATSTARADRASAARAPTRGLARSVYLFGLFRHEAADPDTFYHYLAADTVRHVRRYVDPDGCIAIDVGAGPGYTAEALKAAGASCHVVEYSRPSSSCTIAVRTPRLVATVRRSRCATAAPRSCTAGPARPGGDRRGNHGVPGLRSVLAEHPPRFDWPTFYGRARTPAWIAGMLLVADALIEIVSRAKHRAGRPSDRPTNTESETAPEPESVRSES